jgi:hypothetical protein
MPVRAVVLDKNDPFAGEGNVAYEHLGQVAVYYVNVPDEASPASDYAHHP